MKWNEPTRPMIQALRWAAHWGGNVYPDQFGSMFTKPGGKAGSGEQGGFMPSTFLRLVISGHMARNSAGGLGITELGFDLINSGKR